MASLEGRQTTGRPGWRSVIALTLPLVVLGASYGATHREPRRVLRVCADPNNLPFSNERGEGFENKIAALIASDLHADVEYYWRPQRRGYVRNTLRARQCDVIPGWLAETDGPPTRATQPYYRSSYVFVTRKDRDLAVSSLDDPRLKTLRIGVHFVGADYGNPPPAIALGARGIVANVRGYSLFGDYSEPNPPAELIDAVARGEIDVAIAWGPIAGFFAARSPVPLRISPVDARRAEDGIPFAFDVVMAVRSRDSVLARQLDGALQHHRSDIARLLERYDVPVTTMRAEVKR